MKVAGLNPNIPQQEGIEITCTAYDNVHKNNPPIPTKYLWEMLRLDSNDRHYLQPMRLLPGTKTAVCFANIFMAKIATEII